jgi:hypothetical protein
MQADWSALTRYPHHDHGDPKKHAWREALLVRLNGIEGLWNRLKSAGLGTQGANRPRVLEMEKVEMLLSLNLLSMSALMLVDQRKQKGLPVNAVPPIALVASQGPATPALGPAQPAASAKAPAGKKKTAARRLGYHGALRRLNTGK